MKHSYKILSAVIVLSVIASVAHAQVNAAVTGSVAMPVVTSVVAHTSIVSSTSTVSGTDVSPVDLNVGVAGSANTNTAAANPTAVTSSVMLESPAVDTSSNTSVSVAYVHPAKLFGFISTNLTEQATVSADAQGNVTVTVHKPWWAIFASSSANSAAFEAAIKANVQDQSVDANGDLSASAKAALVSQIETAAQATYSGSASASGSTY